MKRFGEEVRSEVREGLDSVEARWPGDLASLLGAKPPAKAETAEHEPKATDGDDEQTGEQEATAAAVEDEINPQHASLLAALEPRLRQSDIRQATAIDRIMRDHVAPVEQECRR